VCVCVICAIAVEVLPNRKHDFQFAPSYRNFHYNAQMG